MAPYTRKPNRCVVFKADHTVVTPGSILTIGNGEVIAEYDEITRTYCAGQIVEFPNAKIAREFVKAIGETYCQIGTESTK